MRGRILGLGMMALMAAAVGPGVEAQDRSFAWQGEMRAGQVLEVRGIVGDIRAEFTSGRTAEVVAVKDGRERDFDEVEIRVVEQRNGYKICAVYHAHATRGEGCDNDHDWNDGDRRHSIDVDVNYVVRLPAGVELDAAVVSGEVRAEGLRSEVRASTVDGDVFVSTTEKAWGNTVSGDIEIEMGSTDWQDLDFNTVSGNITLWLPAGIDTDVDFDSLSGDIHSDFDITMTGRRSRRWIGSNVEGYIGSRGERTLSFNTISGDVTLRRAR